MMNKVLIIGGGGREHALAWKLSQSTKVEKIFAAPGNPGISKFAEIVNIPANNIGGLLDFAVKNNIDLTVVGPDDPLALGIVDIFREKGLKIFGPTKAAAQIESSKAFAKELMSQNNIPTAEYKTFENYNEAWEYTKIKGAPIVIKASGLALGKGVAVCQNLEEAENFLRDCMVNKIFGEAGTKVVVEQFLQGQEFSAHALCDGKNFIMFPPSQDHKRVFNNDQGPNTGGMGTIAPLPWVTNELMSQVSSQIVKPALEGLKKISAPFNGLLYPGLIACYPSLTLPLKGRETALQAGTSVPIPLPLGEGLGEGAIKVIEFNSRFGDPECESYMRLLKSDLFDALLASAEGNITNIKLKWESGYACCIILASGGYPGPYEKSKEIVGIDKAEQLNGVIVFHCGTKIDNEKLVTNGGRVLGVTAIADDLQSALDKAYAAIKLISFEGMHYRTDIGAKSLTNNQA